MRGEKVSKHSVKYKLNSLKITPFKIFPPHVFTSHKPYIIYFKNGVLCLQHSNPAN